VTSALQVTSAVAEFAPDGRPPNFVIIFLDDSGWGDFRPFARTSYETPNVNRLAEEGCRFNQFYVPQAVCSASRAALLTGCYPGRTRVFGAHVPRAKGLNPKYKTIAEILKKKEYTTAVFGKWHIGDQPETRPPARGFDESCGLMYSNDMWKHHPSKRCFDKWPLQYWDNGKVTIEDVTADDQKNLTKWYTERAVDFINRKKDEPFFLYLPHSMPHVPLFCSEEFEGKSGVGLYGDVMMEIDWSVGEITAALKENGLESNTLVMFTSDNGPWLSYGNHGGSTPFREGKSTSFDGGTRSACIIKYPQMIKAGSVSDKAFCSIDILPVFADMAGAELPDYPIDGKNVIDLISGGIGAENPHEYYAFSVGSDFQGIISGDGRWKLYLPHKYRKLVKPRMDGHPGIYNYEATIELSLFDMKNDPYETTNILGKYPEIVAEMNALAEQHKQRFYK
jgi:arylsulfatase A